MLSGRLPPGSSIAPRSGNTGNRPGRLVAISLTWSISAEQDGRQHAAALERGRILGPEGIEELDELAPRLVVLPLAVALHDLDQMLHGRLRLAPQEQHRGQA